MTPHANYLLSGEQWAGKLFDCIDGNKDDEITCDELVEQCKRDPTILQVRAVNRSSQNIRSPDHVFLRHYVQATALDSTFG